MDTALTQLVSSKNKFKRSYFTVGTRQSEILKQEEIKKKPSKPICKEILTRIPTTIWNESRFVLRAWTLCISVLAFLLLLSLTDGRLAIIQVSETYTEVLGYWTNCQRHICPDLRKVTVSKHLGMGFMTLALASEIFCLLFMGLSFRPIFRRIKRCDLVFGFLNYVTGVLILLALLLFTHECETIYPIKVTYVFPYYLCWCSVVLQFLSGTLCLFNYQHTFSLSKTNQRIQQTISEPLDKRIETIPAGRRRTTFHLSSQILES
ncbi:uncharacterized protein LOC141492206 isoform X1 [Macrotis lagotis]|uniref:uncharacterized protein LOC141492206 isoform X1 n=1 Tax=Macrotis lagotis TaxID=92651 RepID=UPI003D68797D